MYQPCGDYGDYNRRWKKSRSFLSVATCELTLVVTPCQLYPYHTASLQCLQHDLLRLYSDSSVDNCYVQTVRAE